MGTVPYAWFALSSDSSDFVELTSAIFLDELHNHKRRQCFNMTIINDDTCENDETFTVVLAKPSNEKHTYIRIYPGMIMIMITDDDNCRRPPRTPPSSTTRTRKQTVQYRCPDRGTDGYICSSQGIHAPIHVMTSLFQHTLHKLMFRQSLSVSYGVSIFIYRQKSCWKGVAPTIQLSCTTSPTTPCYHLPASFYSICP